MLNPHFFKWESILLICLVAVVFGAVTASAYVRPANPTMDYVPQNIGIYDTFYTYFNEPDCRVCHGTSTAERHHHTTYALGGDCLYCHYSYPITIPAEKDCKVCHIDNGIIPYPGVPVGGEDLGFPHHRSDLADSWQCTACHNPNLLSETYTVPVPSYDVSDITPTPGACENCHWQSDQGVDSSGITVGATYPGTDMVEFMNDWDTWTGLTKPTTGPDGLPHPAPIGHSGMQTSGAKWNGTQDNFGLGPGVNRFSIFMPAKPGKDPTFGLEEQPGKIYSECYLCHSQNPDGSINTDPDDPNNIRACETCHDIYTLHDIEEHMTTNNIYTVAGVLNQTIYCEAGSAWKCLACHGNYIGLPPTAAETPAILPLSYNFGSPGVVFDILPDAVSFGLKEAGDHVEMCQPSVVDCTVAANWEEVPTYSWDEHLIRARVPGWTFAPDTNTKVRVVKAGASPKKSNQRNFTIRKHPEITTLAPSAGQYGDDVIVYGLGFYTNQHTVPSGDYGFYTYVELSSSNDTYRVIKYPNGVDPWSPGDFGMRLKPLLDVRTGSPIPPSLATLLYVGNWNVTVVTDYFLDDGDGTYFDSATGKLDLRVEDVEPWNLADGPMGTGTGDELVWRERSVPAVFNVNSNPAIWNINSTKIPAGDSMKVTGINFGSAQGTGDVRVGKCLEVIGDLIPGTTLPIGDDDGKCEGWTEIIGDGRGNDNGKCEDNEPCQKEVCYVKVAGSKLANVKTWSTTKIVAKVPSFGSTGYPKAKCVQVELSNGKISNAFKIKILAP